MFESAVLTANAYAPTYYEERSILSPRNASQMAKSPVKSPFRLSGIQVNLDYAFPEENSETKFYYQVDRVLKLGFLTNKTALRNRLCELWDEAKDDGDSIDVVSVEKFLDFLVENVSIRQPMTAISPNGNLTAVWKNKPADDSFLSLEFLKDGMVRVIASSYHGKRKTSLSGNVDGSSLPAILSSINNKNWLLKA